jgi:hypothetical protein
VLTFHNFGTGLSGGREGEEEKEEDDEGDTPFGTVVLSLIVVGSVTKKNRTKTKPHNQTTHHYPTATGNCLIR